MAHASPTYPAEAQKALQAQLKDPSYCVPQCVTCHTTSVGGTGTANVFGKNLMLYGRLPGKHPELVAGAFDTYFKSTPPPTVPQVNTTFLDGHMGPFYDADQDGRSDYTELLDDDAPATAGPKGQGGVCPDIEYGCFARVAAAPPPADRLGLFSAGLVVLGLTAWRRLKRAPRTT